MRCHGRSKLEFSGKPYNGLYLTRKIQCSESVINSRQGLHVSRKLGAEGRRIGVLTVWV
jgi:hypothetical protein